MMIAQDDRPSGVPEARQLLLTHEAPTVPATPEQQAVSRSMTSSAPSRDSKVRLLFMAIVVVGCAAMVVVNPPRAWEAALLFVAPVFVGLAAGWL
jgi:hypothetical protein